MKRTVICLTILFCLSATPVEAKELSPALQKVLTEQLQELLLQVASLQEELSKMLSLAGDTQQAALLQVAFYKGDYEAAYSVEGLALQPLLPTKIRKGDQMLFSTFTSLVGEDAVSDYISEFRIFNDTENEFGAFVQEDGKGGWILAVNRLGEDLEEVHNDENMTRLLAHEYGHIVFFENTSVRSDFTEKYWETSSMDTYRDRLNSLTNVSKRNAFVTEFYLKNKNFFVSEYAATSPEEDLAESFTTFVTTDKPSVHDTADAKVRFFYAYPNIITIRQELRSSGILNLQ